MDDLGKLFLSFTVENKIGILQGIGLFTFISNLTCNEWDTPYTSNLKIYFMMLKISYLLLKILSLRAEYNRYVMKMYYPSITMLGYTSQSRKFEKLISIHLNKKPPIFRSSHQRCSIKAVLKNFTIFTTRKHLGWSLFLIKLQTLRPATLLKRDSNTGVFLWI